MQEVNDWAYTLHLPQTRGKRKGSYYKKGRTPWNKGMTWEQMGYSEKTIEKLLANLKKHAFKPNHKSSQFDNKRGKPVIQMDENGNRLHWYPSSLNAAKKLGLHARNIRHVCSGERNSCGGFRWKFDERFL
jgi:hypothetical protein